MNPPWKTAQCMQGHCYYDFVWLKHTDSNELQIQQLQDLMAQSSGIEWETLIQLHGRDDFDGEGGKLPPGTHAMNFSKDERATIERVSSCISGIVMSGAG